MALAQAKLGETEAQCIARYGPEFGVQESLGFDVVGDRAASFNLKTAQGSFVINVTFLNGVAGLEKVTAANSAEISQDQKQGILEAESAGLKWSEQNSVYRTDRSDDTVGSETWMRSDGATSICWMAGKLKTGHGWGEIDFSTKEYSSAQKALDRQGGAT